MNITVQEFNKYETLRQNEELNIYKPQPNCGLEYEKILFINKNYLSIKQDAAIYSTTEDEIKQISGLNPPEEKEPECEVLTQYTVEPAITPTSPIKEAVTENDEDVNATPKLTIRERYNQCYTLILEGKTNKEIMQIMGVSNTYIYKIRKQYEKDLPTREEINNNYQEIME